MAVTTLVLKNSKSRDERHATLLEAVRRQLDDPSIEITYTGKGKPLLSGSDKHISVTTTGDVMVCAIGDTNIGIDGENLARFTEQGVRDYVAIAERFFTEEEADYVRDGENDGTRFAKVWIRKEAFCKFTGKGIADFANFSVNDGERFYGRINGVPIKKLNVTFPGSSDYLFIVVGDY